MKRPVNPKIRAQLLAERDAAISLLLDAQAKLGIIRPESIRAPILLMLRATVELCEAHRSILGLPVNHALDLAKQITAEWDASR